MARIRTIKPDIWTDAEFVECSPNARLLFVAGLNFASDHGVLLDKPLQLKMQCFPGSDIDIHSCVDELVSARLWLRTVAPNGDNVLVIRTFHEHQRVDKPNNGKWGDPRKWPGFAERSENDPGTFVDRSPPEGKGREGKGTPHLPTQPQAEPETKKKIEAVERSIVDLRASGRNDIGDLRSWKKTALKNLRSSDEAERVASLVCQFPTAPARVVAAAVESGETRNLAYYAEDAP